jgi:1-acyl-sn-glycerol-3-phosphate acyltransferase
MGPFTSSIFRLAQRAGARIAPLAISGNENKPARGSLLLHPGLVHVHKLPGIGPEEYRDLTSFQLKLLVRARVQQHLDQIEGVVQSPARNG